MSSREDIQPTPTGFRSLSYTCRCGWIDWGHASPRGAMELEAQLSAEKAIRWPLLDSLSVSLNGQPAFVVSYGQGMGSKSADVFVSNTRHWIVRKGLNATEREQVGLGIFMAASMSFEALQGSFPFSIIAGGSSFSPEDLVSNLVGFYRAFRGVDEKSTRTLCGEVSVADSYKVWDEHLPHGFSGLKNRQFRPIYFPCIACKGRKNSLPKELESLVAAPQGQLYVKPRRRFVPSDIRATFNFDSSGIMRIRQPAAAVVD